MITRKTFWENVQLGIAHGMLLALGLALAAIFLLAAVELGVAASG